MNPWQRGKKAPERSPLARAVGKRPLGRPRRSGSSQLVVVVENNKRGRREPPAFFFVPPQLDRLDRASPSGCPRCLAHRLALGRRSPHVRPECRCRLVSLAVRDHDAYRLDTHLIIVVMRDILCSHRSPLVCLTPRHGRSDGPQSSVCATFATQRQHLVRQLLAEKKALQWEGPTTRNDTSLDWALCRNATRLPSARGMSRRCIPFPDRHAPR